MSITRPPFVGWLARNEAGHARIHFVPQHDGWDKLSHPNGRIQFCPMQDTFVHYIATLCLAFGDRFCCIQHTTTPNMD